MYLRKMLASEKAKELNTSGLKFSNIRNTKLRYRLGTNMDKTWMKETVHVKSVGDRIIALKFIMEWKIFFVANSYAQVRKEEQYKVKFWNEVIHGVSGIENISAEGNTILDFANSFDLL